MLRSRFAGNSASASVSVVVVLVTIDCLVLRMLDIVTPKPKNEDNHQARGLGIDFMASRLAFFVMLLAWYWRNEALCLTFAFQTGVVVWLAVRPCYAEIKMDLHGSRRFLD